MQDKIKKEKADLPGPNRNTPVAMQKSDMDEIDIGPRIITFGLGGWYDEADKKIFARTFNAASPRSRLRGQCLEQC